MWQFLPFFYLSSFGKLVIQEIIQPGEGQHQQHILLGACFLTEEWLDVDALSVLQKQAGLFPEREKWYYLFSTSDFVAGFEAISGSHVRAFSLEEMCRIIDNL